MSYKFFNIGKANARIDELETQLAAVTKERDDARNALEANGADVTKQAEELQTQLTEVQGQVTSLTEQLTQANADLKAAKDQLAAQPVEIKKAAAAQAQQITAAQGQPPVRVVPATKPNETAGSILEQFNAITDPIARTAFFRANREALRAASNAERSGK